MLQKLSTNFVMGYAFNLCKKSISIVRCNKRSGKEGIDMAQNRVRIVDVADALGLSTATVSKVIHGKTEKIYDETAMECLEAMRDGLDCESEIVLPVKLVKRESTGSL